MASPVIIDIPGIGQVEAKNAATEATLREILKAIKGGGLGGGGGGGVPGGGGGAAGGGGGAAGRGGMAGVGRSAGLAAKGLMKMGGAIGIAVGAAVRFGEGVVKTVEQIANVGDSVSNAASVFSSIPIVGTMFSAVAAASEKVNDSYLAAAKSGASFGGSMNQFAASASAAGMEMGKFGQFISANSSKIIAFGGNVEAGAKNFVRISKQVRQTSSDLYALGFSTQEINQGIANYGNLLRIQGRQGTMTNTQLAEASRKYMKEIDALAKATGMERAEVEAKMAQVQQDAQFHGFMATKSKEVRDSFAGLLTTAESASPELAGMIKDYVTTGTFTNAENAKTAGMMGAEAQRTLQMLRQMALNGQKLTASQQDEVFRSLGKASKQMTDRYGSTLSATSGEFDHALKTSIGLNKLHDQSLQAAVNSQNAATNGSDGMNQQLQKAKESLAAISNEFTMYLANSGILQMMLDAFKGLVGIIREYVVPIFHGMIGVMKFLWKGLFEPITIILQAFFEILKLIAKPFIYLTGLLWEFTQPIRDLSVIFYKNLIPTIWAVGDTIEDAFYAVTDTIRDFVAPAFDFVGRIAGDVGKFFKENFHPAVKMVSDWFANTFLKPFRETVDVVGNKLKPVLEPVANLFAKIREEVGNWFRKFNSLNDVIDYTKLKLDAMGIALSKFALWVDEKTTFFANDEEKAAFEKKREEIAQREAEHKQKTEALENRLQKQATENLEKEKAAEAQREKERAERDRRLAAERAKRDKDYAQKNYDHRAGLDSKAAADAKAAAGAECDVVKNYEDSIQLLVAEGQQQNSPMYKEAKAADKKAMEEAEAKKKALEKAAEDKAKQESKSKENAARDMLATGVPLTEEQAKMKAMAGTGTASSSDIAELSKSMAALVKIAKEQKEINERQLSVQQNMTGNVFA